MESVKSEDERAGNEMFHFKATWRLRLDRRCDAVASESDDSSVVTPPPGCKLFCDTGWCRMVAGHGTERCGAAACWGTGQWNWGTGGLSFKQIMHSEAVAVYDWLVPKRSLLLSLNVKKMLS